MQNVKGKNGIKKGIDRQLTLKMARSLPPIETAELEADLSFKSFLSLWKARLEDYSKDETLEDWERKKAGKKAFTLAVGKGKGGGSTYGIVLSKS